MDHVRDRFAVLRVEGLGNNDGRRKEAFLLVEEKGEKKRFMIKGLEKMSQKVMINPMFHL